MMETEQTTQVQAIKDTLSAVTYQLRGDLANLYSALQFIAPPEVRGNDPELDRNAALLCHSYYRIMRLVNNLSALSELTDEKPLPKTNVNLPELLSDLCREITPLAQSLGIDLTYSCETGNHLVGVNQSATQRITMNLLSNALKFTPKGGTVRVSLRFTGGQALLSVSDNGCGITAEKQSTLFNPPSPLTPEPHPHGLGLGLPLSRLLAMRQGGRLILQSAEGQGTIVTVALPDQRVQGQPLQVSDLSFEYGCGFNQTLLELSDALPYRYFTQKHLD